MADVTTELSSTTTSTSTPTTTTTMSSSTTTTTSSTMVPKTTTTNDMTSESQEPSSTTTTSTTTTTGATTQKATTSTISSTYVQSTTSSPGLPTYAYIIIGVGAAVILLLIVFAIIFIIWRRKKAKRRVASGSEAVRLSSPVRRANTRPEISRPVALEVAMNNLGQGDVNNSFPPPTPTNKKPVTSRKIRLSDFQERMESMHRDHDFMFQAEFERLNEISDNLPEDKSGMVAVEECNIAKNRFADVLPYEETRVFLDVEGENTNYINASFIDGYSRPREYIASQGPISGQEEKQLQGRKMATIVDFWLAIWQQNVRCIVMLTQCVENFRHKCGQYWPTDVNSYQYYGELKITLQNEVTRDICMSRTFLVERNDESHKVYQWHFKEWEDTKGLNEAKNLLHFIEYIQNSGTISPAAPSMIHCSAGVGRTGTYIALDILVQHIRDNDFVDVLGCVYALRKQRVRMVQTLEQYILLYDCLDIAIQQKLNEDYRDTSEDGLSRQNSIDDNFDISINPETLNCLPSTNHNDATGIEMNAI